MAIKKRKNRNNEATKDKALAKKLTPEQLDAAKNRLVDGLKSAFHSDSIVERLWQDLLPSIKSGEVGTAITKQFREAYVSGMMVYGLENHFPLSQTVEKEYQPLVIEFSRQLHADYNCQTAGEKALTEVIVSAYIRILTYSRRLNNSMSESTPISENHRGYYSILSKELDRANRHFLSAYQTLIYLKQPPLKVQVKTTNAFIAQAQQFNANKEEPTYEPIVTP